MPKNNDSRFPAISAGRAGAGEYTIIDGAPTVMLPQADHNGIMSCSDSSITLSYGMLALADLFKYEMDHRKVYLETGLRPEWYHTALLWAADHHMQVHNSPCAFAETPAPDQKKYPARWARWKILSPRNRSRSKDPMELLLDTYLESTNYRIRLGVIANFKSIQEAFDAIEESPGSYDPGQSGEGQPGEEGGGPAGAGIMDALSKMGKFSGNAISEHARWGEMIFVYPPLSRPVRSSVTAMRPRPGFTGAFRYPLRAAIPVADGRAFGERKKVAGGTILIDVSGSMQISEHKIQKMVLDRPSLKVAIYSGGDPDDRHGKLQVIARNGHTVSSIPEFGGGNIIDGPALKWLAKQKHPRIWVCDGAVTGVNDAPSRSLTEEAFRTQIKGRIVRFDNLADLGRSRYFKASRKK